MDHSSRSQFSIHHFIEPLDQLEVENRAVVVGCSTCRTLDDATDQLTTLVRIRGDDPYFVKVAVPEGIFSFRAHAPRSEWHYLAQGVRAALTRHELQNIAVVADVACEAISDRELPLRIHLATVGCRVFSRFFPDSDVRLRLNLRPPETDRPVSTYHFLKRNWQEMFGATFTI